jgi:lipoprotein-releasing system permease protein
MKLAFSIAKRFLGYNKGQTIMIMIGIAIGVSVQIFIGLLITGLQEGLIDKTVGSSPHITIKQADESHFDSEPLNLKVRDEYTALSYQADGPAFVIFEDESESILLRGSSEDADLIYGYSEKLTEGRMPKSINEVIVGIGLKDKLSLDLNDQVDVRTIENNLESMKVVGFFDLKISSLNNAWMISNLETAQILFSFGNRINSIEIQIDDVFIADTLAEEIKTSVNNIETENNTFKVDNWKAQNEELLSGLNGQSISSIMIQVFVLISVVLGIASVLAITVLQKSKQIGILKAMGIPDNTASLIFLFQGLILGVYGAILGVLFGLGLIVSFTTFARNPDGSALIAINYDIPFILFSASIAVLSALIASFIPAARSKKLSPIEVIRNG